MAKSNSFFGKRRGSTKNFTFTVFNGHQVTKEKAEQVKNPRTLAQMRNRMVLTTSSAAYAAMKEIVDHSFEGYKYGLQNMSRFQSLNNKLLRANIGAATPQFAYCNYGEAQLLPGAYQVSDGSLATISNGLVSVAGNDDNGVIVQINAAATEQPVTSNRILERFGLNVGDLATIVAIVGNNDEGTEFGFMFLRFKVTLASDTTLTAENLGNFVEFESNSQITISGISSGQIEMVVAMQGASRAGAVAYGIIHSRLSNSVWARSKCVLSLNTTMGELAPSANSAIATYPVGGSYILNDGDIPGGSSVGPNEGGDDTGEP